MNKSEIKSKIGKVVKYKGIEYKFTGCIFRKKDDGNFYYQAELTDLGSNSLIICKLEDVE